jgi:CBS domain-containing protein
MHRRIIPGVIDGEQTLCTLPPDATVKAAADLMAQRRIGAIMVIADGRLRGIVTERDIVYRVVAKDLPAQTTQLGAVMTTEPETLAPDDTAMTALQRMQTGRYRHLPVLRGDEVCGMVSIRDIYEAVRNSLQEELESTEAMIYGSQYGATG